MTTSLAWHQSTFQRCFLEQQLTNWQLMVSQETVSTMDDARASLASGGTIPLCIISRTQRSGRGQQGRVWQSNPGGMYVTYVFPVEKQVALGGFSLVVGVVIATLLRDFGVDIRLKWPNDLIANGKKLGGILTEVLPRADSQALLIGIGVNFTNQVNPNIATSLSELTSEAPEISDVAAKLASALERALRVFAAEGLRPFLQEWKQRDYLAGRIIKIQVAGEDIDGRVIGVNEGGALMLQSGNLLRELWSGHILAIASDDD